LPQSTGQPPNISRRRRPHQLLVLRRRRSCDRLASTRLRARRRCTLPASGRGPAACLSSPVAALQSQVLDVRATPGRRSRCRRAGPRTATATWHSTSRELPQVEGVRLTGQTAIPARNPASASRSDSVNVGSMATREVEGVVGSSRHLLKQPGPGGRFGGGLPGAGQRLAERVCGVPVVASWMAARPTASEVSAVMAAANRACPGCARRGAGPHTSPRGLARAGTRSHRAGQAPVFGDRRAQCTFELIITEPAHALSSAGPARSRAALAIRSTS
jgi:hypothetical protein